MRIGINALTLTDRNSGIGNYTLELMNAMAEVFSEETYILFSGHGEKVRSILHPGIQIVDMPMASKNRYSRLFSEQVLLPLRAGKAGLDVMFSPAFTMPLMSPAKNAVTVHDLAYKVYPEASAVIPRIYMGIFFDGSIRRADQIITVSEATGRDLLKFFPETKSVKTIYEGVCRFDRREGRRPEGLNPKDSFALVVGTITPRKNAIGIIQAYESVSDLTKMKLVFVGGFAWKNREVFDYIESRGLGGRVILTGYLEDEELAWCYRHARMLLYCSFYEGFGFPPLEAMASGIPVIASNVSSIPEVTGDAALLVDPYETVAIGKAMIRLERDEELRRSLIEKGEKRHGLFTWEKAARETHAIFSALAEGEGGSP